MWQQELGIRIGTANQEWKVYLDSRRTRNFEILRASWIGDYPDPVTFLGLWTADSTNNTTGWSNAEYDRLLHQAAREKDPATRYQLLSQAEGILMEEMPVIPLYFLNRTYLLDPRVRGWDTNLLDRRPWSSISFAKE
jgi:oligopeptide transport system substrate-binding protein